MSYGQVVRLAKKIVEAEKRISMARSDLAEDQRMENLVALMVRKAYLAGLCAGMEDAASEASKAMQTGGFAEWRDLHDMLKGNR